MAPLTGNPFADVPWALEQLDAFVFSLGEKTHNLPVHQCRLAEVEHEVRAVPPDLRLNRGEMIFLDPPAQSQRRSFAIERALDFERHARSARHTPRHREVRVVLRVMFSGVANQLAIANWLALAPSLHDDRCTLTDVGVDQTPVLETSRLGEGEAERRRELRVAWR